MPRPLSLAAALLVLATAAAAQDPGVQGNWLTPGGAVVRIGPCATEPGAICATLVKSEPDSPSTVDGQNPDPAKRTRKLCGLEIGYGFHLTDPTHADNGHLYDPKSGKTYSGVMSSNGDQLDLRGYIGIKAFGRTETWTRTSASAVCQ